MATKTTKTKPTPAPSMSRLAQSDFVYSKPMPLRAFAADNRQIIGSLAGVHDNSLSTSRSPSPNAVPSQKRDTQYIDGLRFSMSPSISSRPSPKEQMVQMLVAIRRASWPRR